MITINHPATRQARRNGVQRRFQLGWLPLLTLALLLSTALLLSGCAKEETGESEGVAVAPVNIGTALTGGAPLIYAGYVGPEGSYYYATVSPGSTGQSYSASLTSLSADADLYVYGVDGAIFTSYNPICARPAFGSTSETCLFDTGASDSTIFFLVKLAEGDSSDYNLTITPPP